jgi:putative membrane protein (TIGR04086 family)
VELQYHSQKTLCGVREAEKKEEKPSLKPLLLRALCSAAAGALVFALLLLPAAAFCLRLDLPQQMLPLVALPLAALAAAVAGYFGVRPVRRQGLLLGVISASVLYVIVLLGVCLLLHSPLGVNSIALLAVMLLGGAAGGIFCANRIVTKRIKR